MDVIIDLIKDNTDLFGILLTIAVGFVAWICKSLIDTPMRQSRETFFHIADRRVAALTELYNYINVIALFPEEKSLREDLQKIILSDKMAYVDECLNIDIMEIAFHEHVDERRLLDIRSRIKQQLDRCAAKIKKENDYYLNHDNRNVLKRTIAYIVQFVKVVGLLILLSVSSYYLLKALLVLPVGWMVACVVLLVVIAWLADRYFC